MKTTLNDLNQALTYYLEGMYDAEKKLQKSLPGLLKSVKSPVLKNEIRNYTDSAADKRTKLKRIFSYLLAGPFGRQNKAMDEMLDDARRVLTLISNPELKDAMLIACLQEINHYKISTYGTARTFAEELDLTTVADLLSELLDWEKQTNMNLSKIAMKGVNKKAAALSFAEKA